MTSSLVIMCCRSLVWMESYYYFLEMYVVLNLMIDAENGGSRI